MIEYKKLELNVEAIKHLYTINEWTNYTNNITSLINGIKQSLLCLGAYDNNQLVGLIRVVGDSETIIYIQDILVDPNYQRQGIGTDLINYVLDTFKHVRQIVLTTDQTDKEALFYQSLGFKKFDEFNLVGYYYSRK